MIFKYFDFFVLKFIKKKHLENTKFKTTKIIYKDLNVSFFRFFFKNLTIILLTFIIILDKKALKITKYA